MKEKELDAWFEENREMPEIDDYARARDWYWGKGGYQEKLDIYFMFNPEKVPKDYSKRDVMDYKPKLGQHCLHWAMHNKFHGTEEWKEARENMMKFPKY